MSKKSDRVVPPKPRIKGARLLIDPALVSPTNQSNSQSALEHELSIEDHTTAQELKGLRVQEVIAKRKARIAKLKRDAQGRERGGVVGEDVSITMSKALLTNPQVQKQFLEMTPEQRQVILTSVNSMAAARGMELEGMKSAYPLMMMQMRQNPGSTVKEMVELINAVTGGQNKKSDVTETIQLINAVNAAKGGGGSNTLETAMTFYETVTQKDKEIAFKDRQMQNQEVTYLREQIRPLGEQIQSIQAAGEALGMTRGGSDVQAQKILIEHQKWQTEQQFQLQEREWEHQKWRDEQELKKQSESKRWDTLKEIGSGWMNKIGPLVDAAVQSGTSRVQNMATPGVAAQPRVVKKDPNTDTFPCPDCGKPINAKGDPDTVTCDSPEGCGKVFTKKV